MSVFFSNNSWPHCSHPVRLSSCCFFTSFLRVQLHSDLFILFTQLGKKMLFGSVMMTEGYVERKTHLISALFVLPGNGNNALFVGIIGSVDNEWFTRTKTLNAYRCLLR